MHLFKKHTGHISKLKRKRPNSKFLQEFERIIIIFSDNAFELKTSNIKIIKPNMLGSFKMYF